MELKLDIRKLNPATTEYNAIPGGPNSEESKTRRAAVEFESLVLTQLTSTLKPTHDEDEEQIFGSSNELPYQMFSEQMASSMAHNGGIGMADVLVRGLNAQKHKLEPKDTEMSRAIETMRELKQGNRPEALKSDTHQLSQDNRLVTRPRRVLNNAQSNRDTNRDNRELINSISTLTRNIKIDRPNNFVSNTKSANATKPASTIKPANTTKPANITNPAKPNNTVNPLANTKSTTSVANANSYTGQPHIDSIIKQASDRHNIAPELVAAVISQESSGRRYAVSHKGASGYMQMMPATFHRFAGKNKSIFNPQENINAGVAYLRYLTNKYGNNIDKVLAGYNAGEGNVDKYDGIPPFRETRAYVQSVKREYLGMLDSARERLNTVVNNTVASVRDGVTNLANQATRMIEAKFSGNVASNNLSRPAIMERVSDIPLPSQRVKPQFNGNTANKLEQVALQMPVNGRISSQFGAHRSHGHHKGVDIAVKRGTPIGAAAEGEVTFAGWRHGYGNLVVIKHADGRTTRYAHADKLLVSAGDRVVNGQQIATVGMTGRTTGPHVHFEVLENGRQVNPLRSLRPQVPSPEMIQPNTSDDEWLANRISQMAKTKN